MYLEYQMLLGEHFKGGGQVEKPLKVKMAMIGNLQHHETWYKTDRPLCKQTFSVSFILETCESIMNVWRIAKKKKNPHVVRSLLITALLGSTSCWIALDNDISFEKSLCLNSCLTDRFVLIFILVSHWPFQNYSLSNSQSTWNVPTCFPCSHHLNNSHLVAFKSHYSCLLFKVRYFACLLFTLLWCSLSSFRAEMFWLIIPTVSSLYLLLSVRSNH